MLGPRPDFEGAGEKPKPGIEGATKWKAGSAVLSGSVSGRTTRIASTNEPGQPCEKSRGIAFGEEERVCVKCRTRGPNPGTSILTRKWLNAALRRLCHLSCVSDIINVLYF